MPQHRLRDGTERPGLPNDPGRSACLKVLPLLMGHDAVAQERVETLRIAVLFTSDFGKPLVEDGRLVGQNSGLTLVRRLLSLFDRPILIDHRNAGSLVECEGFTYAGLDRLDVNDTLIVNMDVLSSPEVYRRLKKSVFVYPKIVNFVWWNVSEFHDPVDYASIGVSAALFRTICNSRRTADEIIDSVRRWTSPSLADSAKIVAIPLGVDQNLLPLPDDHADVVPPRVLYPGTFLFARKQPERWLEIVGKTRSMTGLSAVMRVSDLDKARELTAGVGEWLSVEPLLPSKADYYASLSEVTAFLATSSDESYGLAYVEALWAGAVGVFPDRAWVWTVVPRRYPFVFKSAEEAAGMLRFAVEQPVKARQMVAEALGGSVMEFLIERHNARDFDDRFGEQVAAWWRQMSR